MRLFGGDRVQAVVEKIGMEEDQPIEAGMLSKSIENAQKKVEGKNFATRKHVLQYDDVMNKQREIIYAERKRVLEGENIRDEIIDMIQKVIKANIGKAIAHEASFSEINYGELENKFSKIFRLEERLNLKDKNFSSQKELEDYILEIGKNKYQEKEDLIGEENMREIERMIMLQVVDSNWMDHIDNMDQLKQGMGLRAIGQDDPVRAYQIEGFDMFDEMINTIQETIVDYVYGFMLRERNTENLVRKSVVNMNKIEEKKQDANEEEQPVNKPIVKGKKVGRNDPCPCGSGKKYKNCCGR